MSNFISSARQFVKQELLKAELEVLSRDRDSTSRAMEPESESEPKKGSDLVVKTRFGRYHEIFVQPINLDKERNVKIPKEVLGELKSNLWVALILMMKDMEPAIDLIPPKVLENPDNYIFFDNDQDERFKHLSNWEIKVFTKAIPELSKYSSSNMLSKLS